MANSRGDNDNPFDLDFRRWSPERVTEFRESLWIARHEIAESPAWNRSCPSKRQMAVRVGVHVEQWLAWERNGIPGGSAWPALLRIYEEEEREIKPGRASLRELTEVMELVGSWSGLADALNVSPRTVTRWLHHMRGVPTKYGYGRLVKIIHEDCIG